LEAQLLRFIRVIILLIILALLASPAQFAFGKPEEDDSNVIYTGTWVSLEFNETSGEISDLVWNETLLFTNISFDKFTLQKTDTKKDSFNAQAFEIIIEIIDSEEVTCNFNAKKDIEISFKLPDDAVISSIDDQTKFIDWTDTNGTLSIDASGAWTTEDSFINSSLTKGRSIEVVINTTASPDDASQKDANKVDKKDKPDIILVQGDTTTTFIASLAAYYLKIKIGHIEAGLRTKDKFQPFPEEINRRLTDCLADLYFAPTNKARENLLKEGVDKKKIFVTGNTVIDALMITLEDQKNEKKQKDFKQRFFNNYGIALNNKKFILITGHRRESFGKDFENICQGIKMIAENYHDIQIIYPVHLNPNVQKPVRKILRKVNGVYLIEPLEYALFVWLMSKSYLILTDSGGIQEEAPSLGKPVLVMRNTTERPEGIEAGTAKLVGTHHERIFSETKKLLEEEKLYQAMAKSINPYGDGKAMERIANILTIELKI